MSQDSVVHYKIRAISSVGSEHLVYTERVGGSNPSLPTPNRILLNPSIWAISSVGSEHLVYTERVGGSNPSLPTVKALAIFSVRLFLFLKLFFL